MLKRTDMLGRLVAALVGIQTEYFGVVLDVINKLSGVDSLRWKACFAKVLREGLEDSAVRVNRSSGLVFP